MLSASRNAVLSVLVCPYCNNLIQKPTTLFCGHSLCAVHLPLPLSVSPCPIQDCASRARPRRNISAPPIPSDAHISLDVTLNKVLALLAKTTDVLDEDSSYLAQDSDSEDDSRQYSRISKPKDFSPPLPRPTTTRSDSDRTDDAPSERQLSTITDGREGHGDERARIQRSIPALGPRFDREPANDRTKADPDRRRRSHRSHAELAENFEKALLLELMCEICFSVYHKPITTPCQHVSTSPPPPRDVLTSQRHSARNVCKCPWTTPLTAHFVAKICLSFHIMTILHKTNSSLPSVCSFCFHFIHSLTDVVSSHQHHPSPRKFVSSPYRFTGGGGTQNPVRYSDIRWPA